MNNENLPETSNNREENMSQITGTQGDTSQSSATPARTVATHSLSDVAAARSAKVGKPVAGSS
jgi:phosphate transport system ATP-binding protein